MKKAFLLGMNSLREILDEVGILFWIESGYVQKNSVSRKTRVPWAETPRLSPWYDIL